MTARDRIVLAVLVVIAVLAIGWVGAVSPKRKEAKKVETQLGEARSQLSTAESQLSTARAAQKQYAAAYSSVVSLGKAVPASQEVPSLMYELSQATQKKNVEFTSISAASAGASGSSASSSSASSAPAASAAAAGFSQMPFTFIFNGSFFSLEHLFQQLNRFTVRTSAGDLQVSGRLLTIQSVKLSPLVSAGSAGASKASSQQLLSGTITATAYVLPAGQSLTGGATSSSPVGSTGSASPASSASSAPAGAAPAVIKVGP